MAILSEASHFQQLCKFCEGTFCELIEPYIVMSNLLGNTCVGVYEHDNGK